MKLTKGVVIRLSKTKSFRQALRRNKARKISLFGSVARNQARLNSDVDFLVEFGRYSDLLDQVGLKQDLEAFLKHKVDVITPRALSQKLKEQIMKEAVSL